MRRIVRAGLAAAAVLAIHLCAVSLLLGGAWLALVERVPFPSGWLATGTHGSVRVVDRHGHVLRHVPATGGDRQIVITRADIAPSVVEATLAGEDHRFFEHDGVDAWAVLRAVRLNLEHGGVYSGASTLTMQLVRLLDPRPRQRGLGAKAEQALLALRLERRWTKEEILVAYLNRAPYGNRTRGIEAASQLYFHKPARDLSDAQATFLAVLPRAPSGYNPLRPEGFARARARQRHVLDLMHTRGALSDARWRAALAEPIEIHRSEARFEAPHVVDAALAHELRGAGHGPSRTVVTTLDARLQREVERQLAYRVKMLPGGQAVQAGVVVIDVKTGDVLAMVGSSDWGAPGGQFNVATAQRPAGTTVLPFVYGLAFERGLTPASILPDVPDMLGEGPSARLRYPAPSGFWAGPVSARRALVEGRLRPVEDVVELIGERELRAGLTGFSVAFGDGLTWDPERPASDGRVRLIDLVAAHATLVRGGVHHPARLIEATLRPGHLLAEPQMADPRLDPRAAWLVTHILADEGARLEAFGPGHAMIFDWPATVSLHDDDGGRDLWAFGATQQVAVGVWVGRLDGRPASGLRARDAAAPILRDVLELAMGGYEPSLFDRPEGIVEDTVCSLSGLHPEDACTHTHTEVFAEGTTPQTTCDWHIALPVDPRNGLLTSWACDDPQIEVRSFATLPAVFDRWRRHKRLEPIAAGTSPLCAPTGQAHFYPEVVWSPDLVPDADIRRATRRRDHSRVAMAP